VILLLAFRNIIRDKKNSVIIMLLTGVITLLFFTGNSIFTRSNKGLRQAYVDNLTGDIIIEKKADVTMNLFGANAPIIEEYFSIQALTAYGSITEILDGFTEIEAYTGQVSTACYLDAPGYRSSTLICGVDAASYFPMFPGIRLLEGHFLAEGERGAMITRARADKIEKADGKKLEIGTPILLTSAGETGFKIREVPVTGIFSYTAGGSFLDEVTIVDVQTARVLAEIQVATSDVEPDAEKLNLLEGDIDDIFSQDLSLNSAGIAGGSEQGNALENGLEYFLGGENISGGGSLSGGGDWNFIIIRLKSGATASRVIAELNMRLGAFDAVALNWRFAAGSSAILVLLLQALFNAGIMLVGIAGVIAIINIMLIAVFRRTREIGTLRAIGASDSYIRSLILSENCVIGLFAGFAGVAAGIAVLCVVNSLRLTISNELIAGVLGGDVLTLDFSPVTALLSVSAALVLSIAASIYPVETAVKIQPVVAIRR
jgi:putative ABC transport system permease protein